MKRRPLSLGGTATGVLVGGLVLVAGVFAGLTLEGLRGSSAGSAAAPAGARSRTPLATVRHRDVSDDVPTPASAPIELPPERPPWEVTPDSIGPVPAGQVPAWVVKPPPPDPRAPTPPVPVPPPDPATHTPAMHNPGGVNGDRPGRPSPGLP